MNGVTFKISGMDELKGKVKAMAAKAPQAVAATTYKFANDVMRESKKMVPVDTGALMNTGKVSLPEIEERKVSVTLGYGDESVDYALAVHENLSPTVNWTRPNSGPKYLETPFKAMQGELPGRIAKALKDLK
jgi:hypothetical protein